jgi:hypothetical protein
MGNRVAIGVYENTVIAWLVGTDPLEVVYKDGRGFLAPAQTELEQQGYQVVMVIQEINPTNILVMVRQ